MVGSPARAASRWVPHVTLQDVVVGVAQPAAAISTRTSPARAGPARFLDGPRPPTSCRMAARLLMSHGRVNVTGSLLGDRKVSPTILDPHRSRHRERMQVIDAVEQAVQHHRVSIRARCMPGTCGCRRQRRCARAAAADVELVCVANGFRRDWPIHAHVDLSAGRIVLPPISTSSVVVRMTVVSGVSKRRPSSMATGSGTGPD